jgi:histone deacetylase complex regulatory component SIN3
MWNQVSESNFFKSLDQMVFFFKAQQSKMYKQKQMELELKQLSGLKNKSIEQLKGGCQRGEFFCTYQSFSFNNVVLYPADVA